MVHTLMGVEEARPARSWAASVPVLSSSLWWKKWRNPLQ